MRIDVIVPCYHAQDQIPNLLGSLISQKISDELDVTLVNDGEENTDYQEAVKTFSPFISIREIKMETNGGPGVARQFGFDHTSNPLVTFIDADDTLSGAFALKILRKQLLQEPYNAICIGSFLEEQENDLYINHENDTVWMFGKLYKREFLVKHDIRFNETRANEDAGFNMMCRLLSSDQEQIKFIKDIIYYWQKTEGSTTRANNCEYSYNQSFVGYTDNMIWAIQEAEKRNPFNGNILHQKVGTMINLYEYYIETVARDKRFIDQNWNCCRKYYKEIYREVKDKIPEETFIQTYNDIMRNAYMGNKLHGIIPCIGIHDFLAKLELEYTDSNTGEIIND
jgi:glycosyltransferase involved in cell wall biosynthesis